MEALQILVKNMEKKDIRKQVFAQRAKTSEAFVQQQSSLIAGKIFALPQFQDASCIYVYMDYNKEASTRPIIEEAIAATKKARTYILDEVMNKAIAEPRKEVGTYAPKIIQMQIDPQKIGDVVGQRGKTINAIIDETGVKIDITDDGAVSICGTEQAMMDQAKKYIEIIASDFTEGQILTGKVVSIKDFGAFLEFAPGKEGLVHISKLAKQRVEKVEDVVSLGDVVKVVCMGKDKMGRVSFSIKDVPADAK